MDGAVPVVVPLAVTVSAGTDELVKAELMFGREDVVTLVVGLVVLVVGAGDGVSLVDGRALELVLGVLALIVLKMVFSMGLLPLYPHTLRKSSVLMSHIMAPPSFLSMT